FICNKLTQLRSQSSRALSLGNTQGQRLEFKLFVQCAISGGFYVGEGVMFAIFTRFPSLPSWLMFISHMLWVLDHVNNSLVYLILNAKLRGKIASLLGFKQKTSVISVVSLRKKIFFSEK
uniref:7TM GPCR serpentine receptor class x (Srx) domain-containing protein n=1 Tax=Romanomermis culicivorax TaxID=13658 RepID=A0A915J5A1_ROMCU